MEVLKSSLEQAFRDYQIPTKRALAETILLDARQSPHALVVARALLQESHDPFTQFEAGAMLKEALLRQWRTLTPQDKSHWLSFFLQLLLHQHTWQHFVRERVAQCYAVVLKRQWLEWDLPDRQHWLTTWQQQTSEALPTEHLLRPWLSLTHALLWEFSSTRASALHLSLSFHMRTRLAFESDALHLLLSHTLSLLSHVAVHAPTSLLLPPLLSLLESLLDWEPLPLSLHALASFDHLSLPDRVLTPYVPPASFLPCLTSPDTLSLLLYVIPRDPTSPTKTSLSCLLSLCRLQRKKDPAHLSAILQTLTSLLASPIAHTRHLLEQQQQQEQIVSLDLSGMQGIADLAQLHQLTRLAHALTLYDIDTILADPSLCATHTLLCLSLTLLSLAALTAHPDEPTERTSEPLDDMLSCMAHLLARTALPAAPLLLRAFLAQRFLLATVECDVSDDHDEDDDLVLFHDQLSWMARIAHSALPECMSVLYRILQHQLQKRQQPQTAGSVVSATDCEETHWTCLVLLFISDTVECHVQGAIQSTMIRGEVPCMAESMVLYAQQTGEALYGVYALVMQLCHCMDTSPLLVCTFLRCIEHLVALYVYHDEPPQGGSLAVSWQQLPLLLPEIERFLRSVYARYASDPTVMTALSAVIAAANARVRDALRASVTAWLVEGLSRVCDAAQPALLQATLSLAGDSVIHTLLQQCVQRPQALYALIQGCPEERITACFDTLYRHAWDARESPFSLPSLQRLCELAMYRVDAARWHALLQLTESVLQTEMVRLETRPWTVERDTQEKEEQDTETLQRVLHVLSVLSRYEEQEDHHSQNAARLVLLSVWARVVRLVMREPTLSPSDGMIAFYTLSSFLLEEMDARQHAVEQQYWHAWMRALEQGLRAPSTVIARLCLESIAGVCRWTALLEGEWQGEVSRSLAPLLGATMDVLLLGVLDSELLECASSALFYLIMTLPAVFEALQQRFIAQQEEKEKSEEGTVVSWRACFAQLMQHVQWTVDKANRTRFLANFETFLVTARSHLRSK